jgi:hypothetical protein
MVEAGIYNREREAVQVYLPDSVYEGFRWGNIRYPQMHLAQVGLAGIEAVTLIKKGEFSWRQLADSKFSPEQLDDLKEVTAKAHSAYQIARVPEGYQSWSSNSAAPIIRDSAFNWIWNSVKAAMFGSAYLFSSWVMDGEMDKTMDCRVLYNPTGFVKEASEKLTNFFEIDGYQNHVTAFAGLWRGMAGALKSEEAIEWAGRLREDIRGRSNEDYQNPLKYAALRVHNTMLQREIRKIVGKEFNRELKESPEYSMILSRTNREIRNEFVASFPYWVSTPRRRGGESVAEV